MLTVEIYCIDMAAQIDPNYVPGEVETRQVYGVSLQQRRNDAKIDAKSFENIVTKNKDVCLSPIHGVCDDFPPQTAPRESRHRPDRRDARSEVHSVKQRSVCLPWLDHRTGRWPTVTHPLHTTCGLQGGQLVAATPPARARAAVQERG